MGRGGRVSPHDPQCSPPPFPPPSALTPISPLPPPSRVPTLQLLSDAHEANFGTPSPAQVSLTPVPGKAILISGHDMYDMHALLEQTEGKGEQAGEAGGRHPKSLSPALLEGCGCLGSRQRERGQGRTSTRHKLLARACS